MRRSLLLAVVAAGVSFLVASCGGTSEPTGTMIAVIDGVSWQGDLRDGYYNTADLDLSVVYGDLDAVTAPDTRHSVSLSLRPVDGRDTLVLNRTPATANAYVIVTSGSFGDDTFDQCLYSTRDSSGSATITEFDVTAGQFAGTFAFFCVCGSDTLQVTDGMWTAQIGVGTGTQPSAVFAPSGY